MTVPPLSPADFPRLDRIRDFVDHTIDFLLNMRQSGHPGGSRSKVPLLTALTLGGHMRFDIRAPEKRFADRFILAAGHCVPLVYSTLALFHEAMRWRFEDSGDPRYLVAGRPRRTLGVEDLLLFRRHGGLSGHAEMEGKTLFFKFNTGPSGHGSTAAVGQALALRMAGAPQVRVFVLEGEGGLTPGANMEARNAAWGYGLSNLCWLVDWNDYGIDSHRISDVVPGTPESWFQASGFRTFGARDGTDWAQLLGALAEAAGPLAPEDRRPSMLWARTRKGRGYLKYDYLSHGTPHPPGHPLFWDTKRPLMEQWGIELDGFGAEGPATLEERVAQTRVNLGRLFDALREDRDLVTWLTDRLAAIGDSVPDSVPGFRMAAQPANPWSDPRFVTPEEYPASLWAAPGERVPNRQALGRWGAWVNAVARRDYGRPLFVAMSADLAESTSVAGFAADYSSDLPGFGKYERSTNPDGVLLPSVITEFVNAGLSTGMASVNFAPAPESEWDGFGAVCSTYGSFVYLKYGMMRLYSQMAQDCPWKLGPVIWVVGHSGPETAEDSRTHFGIFSPACSQLFPKGQVINCHPFEHNEVPVVLAAALATRVPIIALHLTRPPLPVPDRVRLGLPSHFAAGRGAYVMRPFDDDRPRHGTVIVQGSVTTLNLLETLPLLDREGVNLKVVAAVSPELFRLQPESYRNEVLPWNELLDSTYVSNQARIAMTDWSATRISDEYALTPDRDDRWRTGGAVEEVYREAGLAPEQILEGLIRFARDREARLGRLSRDAVR